MEKCASHYAVTPSPSLRQNQGPPPFLCLTPPTLSSLHVTLSPSPIFYRDSSVPSSHTRCNVIHSSDEDALIWHSKTSREYLKVADRPRTMKWTKREMEIQINSSLQIQTDRHRKESSEFQSLPPSIATSSHVSSCTR